MPPQKKRRKSTIGSSKQTAGAEAPRDEVVAAEEGAVVVEGHGVLPAPGGAPIVPGGAPPSELHGRGALPSCVGEPPAQGQGSHRPLAAEVQLDGLPDCLGTRVARPPLDRMAAQAAVDAHLQT